MGSKSVRILFYTRDDHNNQFGGDTVQVVKTKKYLEKEFDVDVFIGGYTDLKSGKYDLVHFFNIRCPQDILTGVRYCVRRQLPYVLSTIYGSYKEGDSKARTGLYSILAGLLPEHSIEYLKLLARFVKSPKLNLSTFQVLFKGYFNSQLYISKHAAALLPNSDTEKESVCDRFQVQRAKCYTIVNGYDDEVFQKQSEIKRDFDVLCVARIESRKGQIDLINAAKLLPDINFHIVGKSSKHGKAYFNLVKVNAPDNVKFYDFVSHDELARLYQRAKIHILPSWIETPGLSSLEAAAMGCTVVVTDRGDTEWYFGDQAYYVEPGNKLSIRRTIETALKAPIDLSVHVARNYTWQNTASATYSVYREILHG